MERSLSSYAALLRTLEGSGVPVPRLPSGPDIRKQGAPCPTRCLISNSDASRCLISNSDACYSLVIAVSAKSIYAIVMQGVVLSQSDALEGSTAQALTARASLVSSASSRPNSEPQLESLPRQWHSTASESSSSPSLPSQLAHRVELNISTVAATLQTYLSQRASLEPPHSARLFPSLGRQLRQAVQAPAPLPDAVVISRGSQSITIPGGQQQPIVVLFTTGETLS